MQRRAWAHRRDHVARGRDARGAQDEILGFEIGSNLIDLSSGTIIVHPLKKDFTLEKYPSGIPGNDTEFIW